MDQGTPNWANANSLIGYTSKDPIHFNGATGAPNPVQLLQFAAQILPAAVAAADMAARTGTERSEWLPSVYYQSGHRTLDHRNASNISWKDYSQYHYLFFGNVPKTLAYSLHP